MSTDDIVWEHVHISKNQNECEHIYIVQSYLDGSYSRRICIDCGKVIELCFYCGKKIGTRELHGNSICDDCHNIKTGW